MRISDWSSDVCSSDLGIGRPFEGAHDAGRYQRRQAQPTRHGLAPSFPAYCRVAPHQEQTAKQPEADEQQGSSELGGLGGRDLRTEQPAHGIMRARQPQHGRSEEHTSELQSLMRSSYAVFCLKKKIKQNTTAAL